MVPEPQSILGAIYEAVKMIKSKVEQVKANKAKCKRLYERVMIITEPLQTLTPDKVKDAQLALEDIHNTLQEAVSLVIKFSEPRGWLKKAINAESDKQAFEEIYQKLAESISHINFGVSVQTLNEVKEFINNKDARAEEDSADSEADKGDHAAIEEILELCRQELIEEQEIRKTVTELSVGQKEELKLLEEQNAKWEILSQQMIALTEQLNNATSKKEVKVTILPNQKRISLQALTFKKLLENKNGKQRWKGLYHQHKVLIECLEGKSDSEEFKLFEREIKILSKLSSESSAPSIVNFHGAYIGDGRICAVFDYNSRSKSLRDLLDEIYQTAIQSNDNQEIKKTNLFHLRRKLKIAEDIATGLNFLHKNEFIHRDLTSSNMLVDERDCIKIGGFGLMKVLQHRADELDIHSIRTVNSDNNSAASKFEIVEWASPELKSKTQVITKKSDVFSFGGILWEIFTGQKAPAVIPYQDMTSIFKSIPTETLKQIPEKIIDLIKDCWNENPESRPDIYTIMSKLSELKKGISSDEHYEEASAYDKAGMKESAYRRYMSAAEKGSFRAETHYAAFIYDGVFCPRDREKAIAIWKRNATQHKHAFAMSKLVAAYEKYEDADNLKEALFWCDKLIARYLEEPEKVPVNEISKQKTKSIELHKRLSFSYEKQGNLKLAIDSWKQMMTRYRKYSDKPLAEDIKLQEIKLAKLNQQLQVLQNMQGAAKEAECVHKSFGL